MNKKYFQLYPNCIPVKGARRSTICDLQKDTYELIPQGLYEILKNHANVPIEDIMSYYDNEIDNLIIEYFDFLVSKDFGMYSDFLYPLPVFDTTYYEAKTICNAVIDFKQTSRHDLLHIVDHLSKLYCEALEIRFFFSMTAEELEHKLTAPIRDCSMRCIEIVVGFDPTFTWEKINTILNHFQRIKKLTIHSASINQFKKLGKSLAILTCEEITSEACCGVVSPYYFISNREVFIESLNKNNCLNRKIGIDSDGNIKNCPSMKKSFGNINDTLLTSVLERSEFTNLWNIAKDQIYTCKDCEFRYICQDCRAYITDIDKPNSKPAKCNYNPYEAKWS